MLYNNGKQVKVSDKFNSKSHPNIFANLRETKEPLDHKKDLMFRLDQRCKLVLPS